MESLRREAWGIFAICILLLFSVGLCDPGYDMLPIEHGMIIDAGSGGNRMHVYQWEPRLFKTLPPPISYPITSGRWTQRMKPGLAVYADRPWDVSEALLPLIEFAKRVLRKDGRREDFWKYPIYLKATGGMRELRFDQREAIMYYIREFFMDKHACPFYFEQSFARVISGEEEGVYGWTAVNFLQGNLLLETQGAGAVDANLTYGTLDLGGASTQISFYRRDQDIVANLFKLQIGAQKHWNVYTHSFLYFGINSARDRMRQMLANNVTGHHQYGMRRRRQRRQRRLLQEEEEDDLESGAKAAAAISFPLRQRRQLHHKKSKDKDQDKDDKKSSSKTTADDEEAAATAAASGTVATTASAQPHPPIYVSDGCLPAGSTETFVSPWDGETYIFKPRSGGSDFDECRRQSWPLLNKGQNTWCSFAHAGQCSLAGAYQPQLPKGSDVQFYAMSGFYHLWQFLRLPRATTLEAMARKGKEICSLSLGGLKDWNSALPASRQNAGFLTTYCFLAAYVVTLIHDGYGFSMDDRFVFVSKINKYKVDWALGSMLYEINSLPWRYVGPGAEMANAAASLDPRVGGGIGAMGPPPIVSDWRDLPDHSGSAATNSTVAAALEAAKATAPNEAEVARSSLVATAVRRAAAEGLLLVPLSALAGLLVLGFVVAELQRRQRASAGTGGSNADRSEASASNAAAARREAGSGSSGRDIAGLPDTSSEAPLLLNRRDSGGTDRRSAYGAVGTER